MQRQISVRYESAELAKRLKARAAREGKSLNTWIVEVLQRAVGLSERRERLKRYTTWSDEDLERFTEELQAQRGIDAKLWK